MSQSNWKLTPEDAERIREAVLCGARQVDLARAYGVSQSSISTAASGETFPPSMYPSPIFRALRRFCAQPRVAA